MSKYTKKSMDRILTNIVDIESYAPTLTANCMQSVNHQNCVLVIVRKENYVDKVKR